jgi:glycosyltransferase involved in cell wall biosynthesis
LELIDNFDLRKSLGKNAKRFVSENYSSEKMAREYEEVYREVLRG